MSLLSAVSADSSLNTWQSVQRMPSHVSDLSTASPRATVHAAPCSSQGCHDTSIPSRQGSAASVTSTRGKASPRSIRSEARGTGTGSVASGAGGCTRPGEAMTSGRVSTAPRSKEDLLRAMLQVPESRSPVSAQAPSQVSPGRVGEQESKERTSRRSHPRTRLPRTSQPHSPQSTTPVQSPRTLARFESLPMEQKQRHANKAHKSSRPGFVAAPSGLERSRSAGPSRSMNTSSSSVSSSLQSQSCRSMSEGPKIGAAPGDRFMFVNRTGHEYDARCQEYEVVTVVKVGGSQLVKVQWQNGFMEQVRMKDLSEMPSLPAAGGSPGMADIPDMPSENDQSLQRLQKSRSPSRRRKEIRRMPDMPTLEGGFIDF